MPSFRRARRKDRGRGRPRERRAEAKQPATLHLGLRFAPQEMPRFSWDSRRSRRTPSAAAGPHPRHASLLQVRQNLLAVCGSCKAQLRRGARLFASSKSDRSRFAEARQPALHYPLRMRMQDAQPFGGGQVGRKESLGGSGSFGAPICAARRLPAKPRTLSARVLPALPIHSPPRAPEFVPGIEADKGPSAARALPPNRGVRRVSSAGVRAGSRAGHASAARPS
jgi:hypothetical protein